MALTKETVVDKKIEVPWKINKCASTCRYCSYRRWNSII